MVKKSIAAKIIRALFVGNTIGILGGFGLYMLAVAVNTLTGATVINPTGVLLIGYGGAVTAAIGVELSKDLAEQ